MDRLGDGAGANIDLGYERLCADSGSSDAGISDALRPEASRRSGLVCNRECSGYRFSGHLVDADVGANGNGCGDDDCARGS